MSVSLTVPTAEYLIEVHNDFTVTAADNWLEENEVPRPFIRINVEHPEGDFVFIMGVDSTMPINRRAQNMLDFLAGLHMIVCGPAVLLGLGDHDAAFALEAASRVAAR